MGNLIAQAAKGTGKDVVGYIGPEISDVGVVVNRGAAAVKTSAALDQGFKGLQPPS
jgi:hypothetical protein